MNRLSVANEWDVLLADERAEGLAEGIVTGLAQARIQLVEHCWGTEVAAQYAKDMASVPPAQRATPGTLAEDYKQGRVPSLYESTTADGGA